MNIATLIATDYAEQRHSLLGLRSPIERAAEVERMCGYDAANRGWWQQSERIDDAERLRKRLAANHVPCRLDTMDKVFLARRQHDRIDRIVRWAARRMKRADDRWALSFTPVRTVA